MKSAAQLQSVLTARAWDKEMLMWIGSEKALYAALAPVEPQVLDLLDLFDPERLPPDDDATREQLQSSLHQYLSALKPGPGHRVVLVVKSIGLLARYDAGLHVFFNCFVGDFALVILLLDGGAERVDWPDEVRCEGNQLLHYFSGPGMVKEFFSTDG